MIPFVISQEVRFSFTRRIFHSLRPVLFFLFVVHRHTHLGSLKGALFFLLSHRHVHLGLLEDTLNSMSIFAFRAVVAGTETTPLSPPPSTHVP